jgi:hypothetical protein
MASTNLSGIRVARWFLLKPKIPIWVNFGGTYLGGKMLIYFMDIWNRDIL